MGARAGLVGLLLLAAAGAGWAQQVSEAPSAATRCLGVVAGAPEAPAYPYEAYQGGVRGGVKVLLVFSAPDKPPRVTVQERTDPRFAEAVEQHARDLRVPCLKPGEGPVQLERDYVFVHDKRKVEWFSARDREATNNVALMKCARHVSGDEKPDYPYPAHSRGLQGRVLAQVSFDAADKPPTVALHVRPSAEQLAEHIDRWLRGLRLPCFQGSPVSTMITYVFIIDGQGGYGFKELPFRTLLGATKGIQAQRLEFDTRTMGCPFDVSFWYRQPQLRNRVGEIGEPNAARRPLLEWMETVEFDAPSRSLDSVWGDSTVITIPCVHVNLAPKKE
jgi:hypothetical protein